MRIIATKKEVEELFLVLLREDISFHPDKKFDDYRIGDTGQPRYDATQIQLRQNLLRQAVDFCTANNIDFYDLYRRTCLYVDVKPKLVEHFPILFQLLGGQKISWKSINIKFSETHATRLKEYTNEGKTHVETNFFDILTEYWKGNVQATRLLQYYKDLLEELHQNLKPAEKIKIRKTLFDFLIEHDLNYLNYIAELAVLNMYIKDKGYSLDDVESELGNGKSADFRFKKPDGSKILIEVVSVRPEEFPEDDAELKYFIEGKCKDKNRIKTNDDDTYLKYNLVPVIWGSGAELMRTAALLKAGLQVDVSNVEDYCAYCTFVNEQTGESEHKFCSLLTLFP
jgi:hypothetical protein